MATIIENEPAQREVVSDGGSSAALILVVLVLAILAVGAFYFMRSGSTVQGPSAPTHAVTGTLHSTNDTGGGTTKSLTVQAR